MDKIIKRVLETLEENGFEAYIVGGYVRDCLLGISSFDVDICTNALPKDIYNLFNISPNKYGGSNIKIKKYNIDITTYRKETKYINRHPNEVEYISDLTTDLLRRDFTINAICMDKEDKVIDKLNGIEDLNNCLIKSIGDANKKMKEDPLRILRAIRFATILNFDIESELKKAIKNNAKLVNTLSKDRLKGEISKILMSKNFLKGLKLFDELGISKYINLEYNDVVYCNDIMGMYAQINIDLSFTKEQKDFIIKIKEIIDNDKIEAIELYKYGLYICTVAGQILNYKKEDIMNMYNSLPIHDKKDIAITGLEVANVLEINPSKIIGKILTDIEEEIVNKSINNDIDSIKKYLLDNKERWL